MKAQINGGSPPYGGWESPITAELVSSAATSIREVVTDGDAIWWSEQRPEEDGRNAICRLQPGREIGAEILEVTPKGVNVDSRVHSYGGAAWWVENGRLFFFDQISAALYLAETFLRESLRESPEPPESMALTPENPDYQYGDGRPTPDGKYFVCVRERSVPLQNTGQENINEIVAVPTDGSQNISILTDGADFYSSPRISPDGKHLLWLQWNHPNMPWDGTELWLARMKGAKLKQPRKIAGSKDGSKDEWIFQPEWIDESELAYVSDCNNWSTLFTYNVKGHNVKGHKPPKNLQENLQGNSQEVLNLKTEIPLPIWSLGESRYCFLEGGDLAYAARSSSRDALHLLPAAYGGAPGQNEAPQTLNSYTSISQIRPYKDGVVALCGSHASEEKIVSISSNTNNNISNNTRNNAAGLESKTLVSISKISSTEDLAEDFFLPPEFLEFPTTEGETAYGLYYEPANPAFPENEPGAKPPLIVMAHGGPTGDARTSLHLGHRFWTSRGFAVLDVNYRGSTGFGREYRQALYGKWGKADIEDSIAGAKYLIESGRVNPEQIAIRGSSSGGLTVLMALATSGIFSCGAIRYGVVDLKALEETTHKYESRYLNRLVLGNLAVGDLATDDLAADDSEKEITYQERSPINHIDKINTPMIIMSGTEDTIVPPAQSRELAKALEAKGLKHQLLMFEGEGHGFRQAQNQIQALTAELDFMKEVLGIP